MKPEEIKLYRAIQKNAEESIKAIDTIGDKSYEDDFSMQITRQSLKYGDIRNRAMAHLLSAKAEPVHENKVQDMIRAGVIHANTLLNTSTSHLAELVIEGSNRNITQICKQLNRNKIENSYATELAKELVDFEEKNIAIMKKYL
ncbi:MAG: hypothetical protein ACI4EX_12060 [Lachnospiraceae bacterium]